MTDFVVFIDSLAPLDLENAEFLQDTMDGEMHATVPRVTPSVMSEIYTGESPAENGMSRIHTDCCEVHGPESKTIMKEADDEGISVLNLNMPYCIPFNPENGMSMATSMGQQQASSPTAQQLLSTPGPTGDLIGDEEHEVVFDHGVDYLVQLFSKARTMSPDFDVVFIGIRLIDSYCHFRYDMGSDGRWADVGERYRDILTEVCDIQMQQLENHGDVFWFSDHGATNLDDVFYMNHWLSENGYLDYEIDFDFIEKAKEHGLMQSFDDPRQRRVENQITPGQPGVTVTEKQAMNNDPYDACVQVYDEDVTDDIIEGLRDTGVFKSVKHKSEVFDEDAEFYEETAEVIPDRGEGLFVTGNIHPEPIGMGWHRTGVHDDTGCYGSTLDTECGDTDPYGIHDRLREVIFNE
jgi:hypothetical protein